MNISRRGFAGGVVGSVVALVMGWKPRTDFTFASTSSAPSGVDTGSRGHAFAFLDGKNLLVGKFFPGQWVCVQADTMKGEVVMLQLPMYKYETRKGRVQILFQSPQHSKDFMKCATEREKSYLA